MIGSLEGIVSWKDERTIILSVGGVGYVVFATPGVLARANTDERLFVFTHMAVREDALDLYGFLSREELTLFRLLIGISGIGPKSAQNVLSLADTPTLLRAIGSGDSVYLTKVSGVGKKLAEKIVHELKDKVATLGIVDTPDSAEIEALEALEVLGYAAKDTRELVRTLASTHITTEAIIHQALRELGGRT
jgi:holliday junction DNA helicase RuvA